MCPVFSFTENIFFLIFKHIGNQKPFENHGSSLSISMNQFGFSGNHYTTPGNHLEISENGLEAPANFMGIGFNL